MPRVAPRRGGEGRAAAACVWRWRGARPQTRRRSAPEPRAPRRPSRARAGDCARAIARARCCAYSLFRCARALGGPACGGRADRRVRLPGLELKMLTEKACAATKHFWCVRFRPPPLFPPPCPPGRPPPLLVACVCGVPVFEEDCPLKKKNTRFTLETAEHRLAQTDWFKSRPIDAIALRCHGKGLGVVERDRYVE